MIYNGTDQIIVETSMADVDTTEPALGLEQMQRHRSRSQWSTSVRSKGGSKSLDIDLDLNSHDREKGLRSKDIPEIASAWKEKGKRLKRIDTEKAITEEVDVAYGRVMFLGASGVGKTSLLRGLKCESFIHAGSSTQLADLKHINQSWAKGKLEHEWKEVDNDDELDELAKLLAAVSIRSSKAASQIISEVKSVHTLYQSHGNQQLSDDEIMIGATQVKVIDDYLQSALERAEKLKPNDIRNIKPAPFLHIWDCGGQTIFLEVLPAFLTPRTMFLLLFDASKSFQETFKSVQLKNGIKVVEEDVGISILHLLKSWLAMIHTHLEKKEEKGVLLDYPRVSLIGTHGDKKISQEECQSVTESLKESFHLIQSHYIVDNTKAGKGNYEEPSYKKIRKEIYKFTTESLVVKAPLSWVLFRKIITKMSKKSVVEYSEAKAIAIACKISEEDVPKALAFFHDLGVILYYPQIKGLRDKVILNPEWFVKCLGKVLSLEGNEEYKMGFMWKLFREKGILVQSLYGAVWKNNAGGISPESIMELMVHLHLAAEVSTKEYPDHDVYQYFVPCSLKNFIGKLNQFEFKMKATRLQIKFNTDFVPPGYFTRFATTVASYKACSLDFDDGVYRNRVCFEFGFDVKYDHVILTESSNAIQIEIGRNVLDNDDIPSFSKICQDFLTIVKASCSEVDDLYHQNLFSDIPDVQSPSLDPLPIKVYSRIKMVCTSDACTSHARPASTESSNSVANHHNVHYLKIDDLGQQELTKNARVSCERSVDFRTLNEEEQHWFSCAQRVNMQSRVSQSEMVKISQGAKDGETLAACLEMLTDWHQINNDGGIPNKVLRLLQRYDNGGGTRTKLIQALHDSNETVLAKKLSNHFNESLATPSSPLDSHTPAVNDKLLQRRGHSFSHPLKPRPDNHQTLWPRTQSVDLPRPIEMNLLQQQDKKITSTSIIAEQSVEIDGDKDGDKLQTKSNQTSLKDSAMPKVLSVSVEPDSIPRTDIDLIRCSRYVSMSCEELAAYLNVDREQFVKSTTDEEQMKNACVYHMLSFWMENEQRTKKDVHDLLIALQEDDAAKRLMNPPSDNRQNCCILL